MTYGQYGQALERSWKKSVLNRPLSVAVPISIAFGYLTVHIKNWGYAVHTTIRTPVATFW